MNNDKYIVYIYIYIYTYAELVELHDVRHRGEAEAGVEGVAARRHDLHELVGELLDEDLFNCLLLLYYYCLMCYYVCISCLVFLFELLDEDERAHEDVGVVQVLPELLQGARIADLLEEVAYALGAEGRVLALVDLLHGGRHRRLILRLKHDVDNLHAGAALSLLLRRLDAAGGVVRRGVAAKTAAAEASHLVRLNVAVVGGLDVHRGDAAGGGRGPARAASRRKRAQGRARGQRSEGGAIVGGGGGLRRHTTAELAGLRADGLRA